MNRKFLDCRQLLFSLLFLMFLPLAVQAAEPEQVTADSIIDACRTEQDHLISGSNTDMRLGALLTAFCIEKALAVRLGVADSDMETYLEITRPALLEDMSMVGRIHWVIWNHPKGCDVSCGTMFHVVHNIFFAEFVSDALRAMMAPK